MSNHSITYPHLSYKERLLEEEKDDLWRKAALDYYCNIANSFYNDWERMWENYKLKNNQLDKSEYTYLCRGLDESMESAYAFVNSYNMIPNIVNELLGEELQRPFNFTVINESPLVANRLEREKRSAIEETVNSIYSIETARTQEIVNAATMARLKNVPKEQVEQAKAEINEKYSKLYNNLPDIANIFEKYKNINTLEEITLSKIMTAFLNKRNVKLLKNDSFYHVIISGIEAIEVVIERVGQLPNLKLINPLNLFYEKSPDTKFLHQADYVGYREFVTVGKILEQFGDRLSQENVNKLVLGSHYNNSGVTGLDAKLTYNKDAPNQWELAQQYNLMAGTNHYNTLETLDPKLGYPHHSFIGTNGFSTDIGLSATPRSNVMGQFVHVYTVYWKTNRKLGRLQFINDYGEADETIVDEHFIVPSNAKKTIEKQKNLNSDKISYIWEDSNKNTFVLEWHWCPEVWKGIRIGYNIYVDVGPVKHAYQSLLDPYEVKIPIYGVIYNNVNAYCTSLIDVVKPWQKLYFAMMSKVLKMIALDRGTWAFLNGLFFDQDKGSAKTIAMLEQFNVAVTNPTGLSKGNLQSLASMKPVDKVDMTNAQNIQFYTEFLKFLDEKIKTSAGMSDQRLAQTNPSMTATDNYRETMNSMNMSEPMFALHDLLWEQVLQGAMEMTLSVLSENNGIMRTMLNDDEKTVLDLGTISLTDNFKLRIGNNTKSMRILKKMEQLTLTLIQNDKTDLGTLVELMEMENLSEFKSKLSEIEKLNAERVQKAQQQQEAHQKEMLQMQLQAKEDEQISKLDDTFLKSYMDYQKEEMKAKYNNVAFDTNKDYNKDGIADYMQIEQMQQKIDNESRKLDIETQKLGMEHEHHIDEINNKQMESRLQSEQKANEAGLKQRLEMIKAKSKTQKAK